MTQDSFSVGLKSLAENNHKLSFDTLTIFSSPLLSVHPIEIKRK
jgi:hypothetical protein